MPEQMGQPPVLPVLSRRAIAVLDEIDRIDIGKIVLRSLIQKRERTVIVSLCVERPAGQIKHRKSVIGDPLV
jgi:hypothetical protein